MNGRLSTAVTRGYRRVWLVRDIARRERDSGASERGPTAMSGRAPDFRHLPAPLQRLGCELAELKRIQDSRERLGPRACCPAPTCAENDGASN